jgi:hypothetical protein
MSRKYDGRFFGFTAFLTVMVSALLMISLGACPTDNFDDVDRIAEVTATPPAGTVTAGATITLACETPGVFIYYTFDGSTPSIANGILYADDDKPVIAALPVTLKAIAVKSDMANSPVLEVSYTGSAVAKPTASFGAGEVIAGRPITLASATPGAAIYYTTDSTMPSSASTLYSESNKPQTFAGTLKAIAIKENMVDSDVLEVTYTAYVAPAWTGAIVPEFYNDSILCVAYGGNTFIGGTYASVLSYSSDGGSTWALAKYPLFSVSGTPLSIRAIAYGNDKFVAVGVYGNIAYASSSDITNWTATTSNFPQTSAATTYGIIYGVAYGSGKFVAVGVDGKIVYAPDTDLSNWTLVSDSTFGTSVIQTITYGGGKFVAASADGKMAWSADGITWTAVANSTFAGTAISGIAYGEGTFVAVGAGGKIAWSEDGATWNAVSNTTFTNTIAINGICYGDGQFIAVGAYDATATKVGFAGSPDGKNWEAITITSYTVDTYSVTYGGGKFVAGGYYAVIARTQ